MDNRDFFGFVFLNAYTITQLIVFKRDEEPVSHDGGKEKCKGAITPSSDDRALPLPFSIPSSYPSSLYNKLPVWKAPLTMAMKNSSFKGLETGLFFWWAVLKRWEPRTDKITKASGWFLIIRMPAVCSLTQFAIDLNLNHCPWSLYPYSSPWQEKSNSEASEVRTTVIFNRGSKGKLRVMVQRRQITKLRLKS